MVSGAWSAAVAVLAPDGLRSSAFGLLFAVQSFGNLVARAAVGILYVATSPEVAFGLASLVIVDALAVIASRRG
jgi:hypothetical protein